VTAMGSMGREWRVITWAAIAFLAVFLAWPLAGVFGRSVFAPGQGLTLEGYRLFFSDRDYYGSLVNTLVLGVSVTLLSTLAGGALAFLVARFRFPMAAIAAAIPFAAFVIPDIVVAYSWILLLGNQGLVTQALGHAGIALPTIYGWFGLVFVMTLQNYPYAFITMLVGFKAMDRNLEQAAAGLGCSPGQVFTRVTLPLITPAIFASALVVFTHVVNSFGIPAVLGTRTPVLAVKIYNEFLNEMGSHPFIQSVMSSILVLLAVGVMVLQKLFVDRRNFQMESGQAAAPEPLAGAARAVAVGTAAVFLVLSLVPIVAVVVASVSDTRGPLVFYGTFTLDNFRRAFEISPRALVNSMFLATVATAFGAAFSMITAYCIVKKRTRATRLLDMALLVPLAVAGTVLGIAMVAAFNSGWIVLTGTWILMAMAYFLRRMPLGVRSAASALHNLRDSVEEASISLGVRPIATFFKVVIPVMRPAVIATAVLIWATTLSELSATLVLYYGGMSTIPIEIYQQIDSGRMAIASAFSVMLLAAIFVPLYAAKRLFRIDPFGVS
jgi:iron(III) transport system permease protein